MNGFTAGNSKIPNSIANIAAAMEITVKMAEKAAMVTAAAAMRMLIIAAAIITTDGCINF